VVNNNLELRLHGVDVCTPNETRMLCDVRDLALQMWVRSIQYGSAFLVNASVVPERSPELGVGMQCTL
jgi:hypothetical protein